MYDILPQAKSIGPNGKEFLYTSPTAEVAGWLLSKTAKKPLEILLSQEIWSKLGTSGEAYTLLDPESKMISTGGLNLTTRDVARFGQMIANNGKFNNQQILPTEVIKSITGGGNKLAWQKGEFSAMMPYINSYHSYWYQTDNKFHAVMAIGVYGQQMYIDTVNNIVIVKFASYPTQYVDAYDDGWVSVYPQIVEALINGT
jgi:CubicO group peptidase (beta-lactamase class C family)